MDERRTGIFGQMKNEDTSLSDDYCTPVSENDPDTIYNLLFRDFDEENN